MQIFHQISQIVGISINHFFSIVAVIGNAVAVLVDVEKRKQYDLHGCDEERMRAHTRSEAYYDQGRRNEGFYKF